MCCMNILTTYYIYNLIIHTDIILICICKIMQIRYIYIYITYYINVIIIYNRLLWKNYPTYWRFGKFDFSSFHSKLDGTCFDLRLARSVLGGSNIFPALTLKTNTVGLKPQGGLEFRWIPCFFLSCDFHLQANSNPQSCNHQRRLLSLSFNAAQVRRFCRPWTLLLERCPWLANQVAPNSLRPARTSEPRDVMVFCRLDDKRSVQCRDSQIEKCSAKLMELFLELWSIARYLEHKNAENNNNLWYMIKMIEIWNDLDLLKTTNISGGAQNAELKSDVLSIFCRSPPRRIFLFGSNQETRNRSCTVRQYTIYPLVNCYITMENHHV